MSELGAGTGSSYPGAIDTDNTVEVNSPSASKTKARAEVPNDLAAAIIAVQTELGTDPAGSLVNVKTFLQTEHGVDGTHDSSVLVKLAGTQTITGEKTFSAIMHLAKGADIISASAVSPGSDGNFFDVTGTTGIGAIASKGVGTFVTFQFDGTLTITHHATNLILPGGVNISTEAGDVYTFFEYASGDWILTGGSHFGTGFYKALSITNAKIANDTIQEGKVDWANAGGMTQFVIEQDEFSSAGSSFATLYTFYLYVPASANSLAYHFETKDNDSGIGTIRINSPTANGSEVTTDSPTYETATSTTDVSSDSGWTEFTLQVKQAAAGTTFVQKLSGRFI